MNLLPAIALPVQLGLLFGLGALLGSLLNLAIYRLAWHRRSYSPWSTPNPMAPPRRWWDHLPIVGWLGLRREAVVHGPAFWVRPMSVEIAAGLGLAWLYWWEVVRQELVAGQLVFWLPPVVTVGPAVPPAVLHATFLSHAILIALMTVAAVIDTDEKMIPDAVTVPGTLAGLILATAFPWSFLPQVDLLPAVPPLGIELPLRGDGPMALPAAGLRLRFLTLTAPADWPAALGGAPRLGALALGLSCFWLWCLALLPRPWYGRHGCKRAWCVLSARLLRSALTWPAALLILLGTTTTVAVWYGGGHRWVALLTALAGLAGGGGIIWAVRLVGTASLRKEALGFGDVTLMMMVGTFLGWQPCLVVFFMAPFAGLVVGLLQLIVKRDHVIPYGPFLCLAALTTLVFWARIWNLVNPVFDVGWLVPAVLIGCLAAMAIMLCLWRLVVVAYQRRQQVR